MNRRRTMALTRRLLAQFRRDRRTLALLFVTPLVLLSLLDPLLRGQGTLPALGVVRTGVGSLSNAVMTNLEASSDVSAARVDEATASRQLADGTIAAYVIVGDASPAEITLEGSEPGVTQKVLAAVVRAYQQSLPQASALQPQVIYLHGGATLDTLDYFGGAFIGLVVFFLVFVITSVAFLRERSQGTLERLMASPLRRGEIVVGYMLGFTALALVQSAEVLAFALVVLHVHNSGNVLLIFLIEALIALAAVNLGIFLSMFARTEFQAVQFIPLVIVPQVLLSGIVFPVATEPGAMQALSRVLPLTYAVDGLRNVMLKGSGVASGAVRLDVLVVLGFAALTSAAAMATLRRRVA